MGITGSFYCWKLLCEAGKALTDFETIVSAIKKHICRGFS